MQPERIEEAREWLSLAYEDRQTAERASADPSLPHSVVFHCQQAAEKSLKGYLTWHGRFFERTHDLTALVLNCQHVDPAFAQLLEAAERLNVYAVDYRYPGSGHGLAADDLREALADAGLVCDFVLARLPPEVHP